MSGHSRSTLFLMEQLVVILIFALCSAVCISIFVEAYLMNRHTLETNAAIRIAGNAAECFKASEADADKIVQALGGVSRPSQPIGDIVIFYDHNWEPCGESQATYILIINTQSILDLTLTQADIYVKRVGGEELFHLTTAVRGSAG